MDKEKRYCKNLNPCCGFFLQGGVRAIAIIDLLLALYSLVTTVTLVVNEQETWNTDRTNNRSALHVRLYLWIWFITHHLSTVCLSAFLFISAHKRISKMCIYWIIVSSILTTLWYANYSVNIYWLGIESPVTAIVQMHFVLIYKMYGIWVVFAFIQEIRECGHFNEVLRGLTDEEVEEFVKGLVPMGNAYSQMPNDPLYKPYNKDYEIHEGDINIDHQNPLGKGAYGTVLPGKFINDSQEQISVAVKTVNQNADVTYFKALLQELKIMTCVGHHDHIVNLIGAITSKVREKTLFIVVELCPNGNLQDYIKDRRNSFFGQIKNERFDPAMGVSQAYSNMPGVTVDTVFSSEDLIRWSLEVCHGMQYLASQRVIHGDLATRNVLLTHDRKCKITDFGLSRQLYSDPNYIKKQIAPLPWRWMAIESLRDLCFSIESDIWSYGITLWEIFTLSEVPYAGLSWTTDFVQELENGLRLGLPKYCTKQLYNNVMLSCWADCPTQRPSYREISEYLESILETFRQ